MTAGPGVTAEVHLGEDRDDLGAQGGRRPVTVSLPSIGVEPYAIGPGPSGWAAPTTGGHPLVEHAIGAILERAALPEGLRASVSVESAVSVVYLLLMGVLGLVVVRRRLDTLLLT